MASEIAQVIRGKNKPTFTPNADTGDFVVVINAEKIKMTGNKWREKKYYFRSRFFGSLTSKSADEMRAQDPTKIIEEAVKGMLPKNKLSYHLIGKLKAYKGPAHPHAAQKPLPLPLETARNRTQET
jgi:large subunit ribosomal protein L13